MIPPPPGDAVLEQMREDKETAESQVCSHVLMNAAAQQNVFVLFVFAVFHSLIHCENVSRQCHWEPRALENFSLKFF